MCSLVHVLYVLLIILFHEVSARIDSSVLNKQNEENKKKNKKAALKAAAELEEAKNAATCRQETEHAESGQDRDITTSRQDRDAPSQQLSRGKASVNPLFPGLYTEMHVTGKQIRIPHIKRCALQFLIVAKQMHILCAFALL